jgi:hypothetical protein
MIRTAIKYKKQKPKMQQNFSFEFHGEGLAVLRDLSAD